MNHDDIEPLEPGVWLVQLRKLASSAPRSEEALNRSLRRGFYLAQLTPRPLRHIVDCNLSERKFEQLLETGAQLTAALALVGDRLNYRVARLDGGGRIEAEVWFPNEKPCGTASGLAVPVAIFQAWLQCLSTLDQRADFSLWSACLPAPRKSQSAQRQKLIEH